MKKAISILMVTLLLSLSFTANVFAQPGYQYPTFTYSGGSAKPNVIQGNRTINSTPNGYNSNLNAVKAYTDPYAARRSYVGTVKITGLESKSVSTISPVCPEFPAHIY